MDETLPVGTDVASARTAFAGRSWSRAYALLAGADRDVSLEPPDLELLAVAAYMLGRDEESADAWTRAHQAHLASGDRARAAECAFWLGWGLFYKGQMAQCGGWFARAQHLVDDLDGDCPARGLLLVPEALRQLMAEGDAAAAHETFAGAARFGEELGVPDLVTLGRLGCGQALIRLGRTREEVALLDEAMVSVTAGEVSAMVAGTVYCAVLLECQVIFDVRRAVEWTAALTAWCDSDPGLVPYRGQCLVHRSEIMQLRGEWTDAIAEADRACDLLSRPPPQPAVGMAYYQQGELHRLRGECRAAEDAYREASRRGRDPQPGLALLRLAEGKADAAHASIRLALDEARDRPTRSKMLGAYVRDRARRR